MSPSLAGKLLCVCSELWWFSSVEKATREVLAISAKRKSLLGSTLVEEEYPVWERNISLLCLEGKGEACVLL